jgi:hypothetical protein
MRLVVYFDGQFWTALIESENEKGYSTASYIFGSEPKEGEILRFVNTRLLPIINAQSEAVGHEKKSIKKINPKRLKRQASKELNSNPVSTVSQKAIQKQLEKNKKERKAISKKEKEGKRDYKRILALERAKEKHRGR